MSDDLGRLLAELPVPASAEARERTVSAARAIAPPRRRSRRRPVVAGAACLLALAVASPPGQAAIERVGDLVGIGDVGEPPTIDPSFGDRSNAGVIVANGHAPDGVGFEWTAYRAGLPDEIDGKPTDGFCVSFDWPDAPGRGGATCSSVPETSRSPFGRDYFTSYNIRWLQSRSEAVRRRDVMLMGTTTREPHALRISYTDLRGDEHELAVSFTRVDGDLLERAGGEEPFGVFTAFMSAQQAHDDRLAARYPDISLIGPVASGPPVDQEQIPPPCRRKREYGPWEYRLYDRRGELLDRVRTVVGRFASPACVEAMEKLAQP